MRLSVMAFVTSCAACATVPPGHAGVVFTPSGVEHQPLGEGVSWVGPFAEVSLYDVRGQSRTEALAALAADGAPVHVNASVVSFHVDPQNLPALERDVGHDYYDAIVRPVVQSAVRRAASRYVGLDFRSSNIEQMEKEAAGDVQRGLSAYPIVLDGLDLRTAAVTSRALTEKIDETSVWEQRVLAAPQELKIAQERARALQAQADAVAHAHATIATTLNASTLAQRRTSAWSQLLRSPSTSIVVRNAGTAAFAEVQP